MARSTYRHVAAVLALLLIWTAFLASAGSRVAARQAAATIEVGAGPIGEPSLRLVGRVAYGQERLEVVGYLTAGTNIARDQLFTSATRRVDTARFTIVAEIGDLERSTQADVRTIAGLGELRIYRDDGGADWDNPATFSDGELLATYGIDLRETLQRQDPTVGVVVGDATLIQEQANEYVDADQAYRFGDVGIASRLRYTGALLRDESGQGAMAAGVTGTVVATNRDAIAVPVGAPATPAP